MVNIDLNEGLGSDRVGSSKCNQLGQMELSWIAELNSMYRLRMSLGSNVNQTNHQKEIYWIVFESVDKWSWVRFTQLSWVKSKFGFILGPQFFIYKKHLKVKKKVN